MCKINVDKELQSKEQIVEDLIKLRDELFIRKDARFLEIFFKINSCLYGEPVKNN